jgi:hypothetical protein
MMMQEGMTLHIRPQFLGPHGDVELIGIQIEPFDIVLYGGKDVIARRPYPNKQYLVACRKQGQKAISGILIETNRVVEEFTCTTLWRVGEQITRHHVNYRVLDHDYRTVSDHMMLWRATEAALGGWPNRLSPALDKVPPIWLQPVMELSPNPRRPNTEDVLDKSSGMVIARRQVFAMPTIEPERLSHSQIVDRLPSIESAFKESSLHVVEMPKRPQIGTCMLCGRSVTGWCGCAKSSVP